MRAGEPPGAGGTGGENAFFTPIILVEGKENIASAGTAAPPNFPFVPAGGAGRGGALPAPRRARAEAEPAGIPPGTEGGLS